MLEVADDMLRLAVCERCVVWVDGETSPASYDSSVVLVWS